jgi:hypothetical protein
MMMVCIENFVRHHGIDKYLNWIELDPASISGFRHDVDEICAVVGYYTLSCGNCLPTFQDGILVPSSRVKSLGRNDSQQP